MYSTVPSRLMRHCLPLVHCVLYRQPRWNPPGGGPSVHQGRVRRPKNDQTSKSDEGCGATCEEVRDENQKRIQVIDMSSTSLAVPVMQSPIGNNRSGVYEGQGSADLHKPCLGDFPNATYMKETEPFAETPGKTSCRNGLAGT